VNLTRLAIERNRVTWVAILFLLVAGLASYRDMPQAEDPGFIIRIATVITVFPGASPERVEQLITDPIEREVQQIPELDFVGSISRTGVSEVYVFIDPSERVMRPIWDDLRRKIDGMRAELPDGVIGPVVNDAFGDVFGIFLAMTGEGYSYVELKEAADRVRDEMLRLDDVAKVLILGDQEERVHVEFSNARLGELGLSPGQLTQILTSQNVVIPGGEVTVGPERIALEPSGEFQTIEELRRTVVTLPGRSEVLYLGDIADIHRGYVDPPTTVMRYDGQPALGLALSLREGGNIVELGEQVDALLDRLESVHPIGLDIHRVTFQPDDVQSLVHLFTSNLLQAVGLVIVVMLLFLGIRTGLVVASLVPTTIAITFLVMALAKIWIDQISLSALIISLGMLVDNAIVMSESILVAMREGKERVQAAVDSARELAGPLLTSSATTAAAFLPIFLAQSVTGEYCAPLFEVVAIALGVSWLLSITLVPMLAVTFIRVEPPTNRDAGASIYDTRGYRTYRRVLVGLLCHPWATLAGIGVVFVLAMVGFGFVPGEFFPASTRPLLIVDAELPPGTDISETDRVASEIEAQVAEAYPPVGGALGVRHLTTFVGGSAPRFTLAFNPTEARTHFAMMIAEVTSAAALGPVSEGLETYARENLPGASVRVSRLAYGPPVGKPVAVRLSGYDTDQLSEMVDALKAELAEIPGAENIGDDWGLRTKKLMVEIDQPRARLAGVSSQDVAISLQANLSGIETTQFREADKAIPVILRSVAADRRDIGKLEGLHVYSQATGRSVPLKQVADVRLAWEASRIRRRQRARTVTVEADVAPGFTVAGVNAAIVPWLEAEGATWGPGYGWELGGEAEASAEANEAIAVKAPYAFFAIVLLLVMQFNSLRKPAIVLATLPLGLIGVAVGLLITRSAFGFMPLLGVIALFGIIINNAVVLLDRIQIEIDENGLSPPHAVVEAAQRRLRPILLTTTTTMVGLVPLAVSGGPMFEPMGVVIIGGLAFATVLTLGVVPVLYVLSYRVRVDRGVLEHFAVETP